MLRYIGRRLLQIPTTLLLVSIIAFSIIHLSPGDPVRLILGDFATADQIAALRHELGYDKSMHLQYIDWMSKAIRGNLGTSVYTGEEVSVLIARRAPYTILLAVLATLVAVAVAPVVGVISAVFHNRAPDQILMFVAMLGMAMPSFVIAILLIMFFSVYLGLLPIAGPGEPFVDPIGSIKYYILPVSSLAFFRIAQFTRITRSSMLDVLNRDYVRVARAKGLSERKIIFVHAMKNALIPVITIVSLSFAATLGGSVVVEMIFSIPGLGTLMIDAIQWRDLPLIQGITLVIALIFIVTNLIADLLYGLVDPRIRYE